MSYQDDAGRIVTLTKNYIPEEKLLEWIIKLDEEVGQRSDSEITKKFLSSLRNVIDKPIAPAPWWVWGSFYTLVVLHLLMVFGILFSFFVLPFYAPWYIAIPLMTFVFFFCTTRVECQLTNMENDLRKRLGLKRIGGFVGHYIIRPIRYFRYKINKK